MKNILVKEYVIGDVRCNVKSTIITDAAIGPSGKLTPATKRHKNFFKSSRRVFYVPKYRFDAYYLDEVQSKLIRALYGPVTMIVYNHSFRKLNLGAYAFMTERKLYKVTRTVTPTAIFYLEIKHSESARCVTRTTIFLSPK